MKVVITGVTGLVGEGVLLVCLENTVVTEVLIITRKPLARKHKKMTELIVTDFSTLNQYREQLKNYDACFFCAGVSAIGKNEASFTGKTYDFVVPFAKTLSKINPF